MIGVKKVSKEFLVAKENFVTIVGYIKEKDIQLERKIKNKNDT
ncbi:unnamed protein product [marine sediment metagenome]|uniref:Uncharacterized protein n=1 Tax=marine sediment metagenome TaxID=412755 RepID=X1FB32_9ZZZZ